ncbi:hypothetical protein CMI47_21205 [Candidatus Pacearchaeota archaeon]|nr:hypothetical protein [Candidatus Pacearchaeota archaeon]|tara:strand:+ start:156 stop:731 length:576 start_codon:yes stop_codon:yes gene_type:complete
MSKRFDNYRKIYKDYYGCSDEEMFNKDIHHIDGDRKNNNPENLSLITPEEHVELHKDSFIKWARIGGKLGNKAYRKRLMNEGPTDKEQKYWDYLSEKLKKEPLHKGYTHSENTKRRISENKKLHFKNKENHPMWGKTTYQVTDPAGNVYIVSGGWKQWCKDRGLGSSDLRAVAKGVRKSHKGYVAIILSER